MSRLNRTQALVLGFFAAAWLALMAITLVAPEILDRTLRALAPVDTPLVRTAFLGALTGFLLALSIGVARGWRWAFWLLLVAFLAGVLRLPASALELAGAAPLPGPAWYAVLQGTIGIVQFGIGLAMLAGYRRSGPWGSF